MAHWSGLSYPLAFPRACEGHSRSQSPTQQPISRPGFTNNILRETRDSAAWAHLPGFVDFSEAVFRVGAAERERAWEEAGLLGALVYRPTVFRRNQVGWISACSWRARAKAADIAELKRAKRELDARLIGEAAGLMATLVHQLRGDRAANAVTCVPCGHSRRPDCLGKQIAQAAADALGLPFLPVFADRPCSGVSHPKEFAKLPKLKQIADPLPLMILIDDLATSGWHVEESLTTLRSLGASAWAFVWITGTVS